MCGYGSVVKCVVASESVCVWVRVCRYVRGCNTNLRLKGGRRAKGGPYARGNAFIRLRIYQEAVHPPKDIPRSSGEHPFMRLEPYPESDILDTCLASSRTTRTDHVRGEMGKGDGDGQWKGVGAGGSQKGGRAEGKRREAVLYH
jgi:hypothetical protein